MYFPSTIKSKTKIRASIRSAKYSLLSKKKNDQNPISPRGVKVFPVNSFLFI